jgi:hypothetical protein
MQRRRALAALGSLAATATAGCLGQFTGSDGSEPITADDLAFTASVVDDSPKSSPPRVSVALEPDGRDVRFAGGTALPFTSFRSTDDALLAVPPDEGGVSPRGDRETIVPDARDGCWRATTNVKTTMELAYETLSPGEAATLDLTVLAAPDADACPVDATYTFQNKLGALPADSPRDDEFATRFTLTYTLTRDTDGRVTEASGRVEPADAGDERQNPR